MLNFLKGFQMKAIKISLLILFIIAVAISSVVMMKVMLFNNL
jgi:hypothetical protein